MCSEFFGGDDAGKVREIVRAMNVDGVRLLDWSLDGAHNRSVVTVAGAPEAVVEAAIRAAGKAAELIDLTQQSGCTRGSARRTWCVCAGQRDLDCGVRDAGSAGWTADRRRYGVPVYFYGAAAARRTGCNWRTCGGGSSRGCARQRSKTRCGGRISAARSCIRAPERARWGEEFSDRLQRVYPAGRQWSDQALPLQPDIASARAIARDIRASNGGLHGVKAIGVAVDGRAQISMNVTDFRVTSMRKVHEAVTAIANGMGWRSPKAS